MKKRSIKFNVAVNGVRTLINILFPMISLSYVSKILLVDNLGMVFFSNSIIAYFLLISSLGISTYAIREGSSLFENKRTFNKFANQIFTINFITTFISYLLLYLTLLLAPSLKDYIILITILSGTIFFTTIGVDWIFSIYEDYVYITIMSFVIQIVSFGLMIIFVRNEHDIQTYALIILFASAISGMVNFLYSRKYLKIKFTIHLDFKKHIKPIMILFSVNIATVIYVASDITMIGFISGVHSVGIYTMSSKIYSLFKTLIVSIIIVSMPRLTYYLSNNNVEKFQESANKIIKGITLILIPIILGINLIGREFILIFSGSEFMEAYEPLRLLSISLLFSTYASFFATSILLSYKKEKFILIATSIAAVVNITMNFILIPLFSHNGAAITTVLSEAIVFGILLIISRKLIKFNGIIKVALISVVSCIPIFIFSNVFKILFTNTFAFLSVTLIVSSISYLLMLILLKNDLVLELINIIKTDFLKWK